MANATLDSMTALGDPTRRAIFERLAHGPSSVGALAAGMPVSRPAVSQHLRVLKDAGLVSDRRDGTRRLYELDAQGMAELRSYLNGFWAAGLEGFKAAAESSERRDG
jgi:DNA-binding transcriptional ArsR family regulator